MTERQHGFPEHLKTAAGVGVVGTAALNASPGYPVVDVVVVFAVFAAVHLIAVAAFAIGRGRIVGAVRRSKRSADAWINAAIGAKTAFIVGLVAGAFTSAILSAAFLREESFAPVRRADGAILWSAVAPISFTAFGLAFAAVTLVCGAGLLLSAPLQLRDGPGRPTGWELFVVANVLGGAVAAPLVVWAALDHNAQLEVSSPEDPVQWPYLSLVWVSWFVAGALLMAVAQCVVAVVRLLLRTAGLKGA